MPTSLEHDDVWGKELLLACPKKPHCKTVWKRWNQILKLQNSEIANIYSSDFFSNLPRWRCIHWEYYLSNVCTINYLHLWQGVVSVYFSLSGCRLSSSSSGLVASWVAVAHAKDAPAVFNLSHLFVCFVNEYAKLERPISSSVSSSQGAVHPARLRLVRRPLLQTDVQTPPGNLAFSPCPFTSHCRPESRFDLATVGTPKLSLRPSWHYRRKWSLELAQVYINILNIQKLKLSMNHRNREGVVMLLNIDFFIWTFVVVSHNSSSGYMLVCVRMCVCVSVFYSFLLCSIH